MLSIISTTIISQVSAAPKKGHYNSHNKITVNSETDEVSVKGGFNSNGPNGHQNYKYSYGTNEYLTSKCIN